MAILTKDLNEALAKRTDADEVSEHDAADNDNITSTTTPERKRRRRRRGKGGKKNYLVSSDDSSNGDTSDSSNDIKVTMKMKQLQRRRREKKQEIEEQLQLTCEEQDMYVAIDCEMVGIGNGGRKSVVARVTLVDWHYNILLDQYITPKESVTDYRTFVSGITHDDLFNNEDAVDIETCRTNVLDILKGKILIGHALKNDLSALGVQHPWQYIRDTAKYEPFMKVRFEEDGILWPRKLKELCMEKLQLNIQLPGTSHSPYEDAVAAFRLYKLVRNKWEKVMDYKIQKTASITLMQKISSTNGQQLQTAIITDSFANYS